MKVNFKRMAATGLAVVMSLGLSVSAFAADSVVAQGSLTVTGDQLIGKTVTAVRMFTARAIAKGEEEVPQYQFDSYDLEDAWLGFFQGNDISYGEAGITIEGGNSKADADDALGYMQWLADQEDSEIADFADDAQKWYRENTKDGSELKSNLNDLTTTSEKATAVPESTTKGTVTLNNLDAGYYLVFPEGGGTGDNAEGTEVSRGTDAMLINIPTNAAGATWNIKSTYPTVDKKVDTDGDGADSNPAADNGSAQVGDTVTFTLTSKVPDMSDYTTFYFGFTDTLTSGLKIVDSNGSAVQDGNPVSIDNLTITIGGEPVTSGYTVSLQGTVLKVEFTNLKEVDQAAETEDTGKEIVVTYKAMITEDATSTNPATNEVKVEYSNDPTTDTKGESTPDKSKVYTYDIDVNKWSSDMTTTNLAGAVFKLTTDEEGNHVVNLIATDETTTGDATDLHNAYRVAKPGETGVETFTTDDDGNINIAGLEAGTYYLHEVTAPSGYNKLKAPVKIEIVVSDSDYENATITVDGNPATGSDGTVVDVENKKGIELPETGSIGTIGLTAAGVVIVLLGVFAPRKKKKSNQE